MRGRSARRLARASDHAKTTGVAVSTSKAFRSSHAKDRRRHEAVDETGLSPLDGVRKAVEQLHRRDRVTVRVVGMGQDREAAEGEVARRQLHTHVEDLSVVRLADITEAGHDPRQARDAVGSVVDDGKADFRHSTQHPKPLGVVRDVPGPGRFVLGDLEIGAPPKLFVLLASPVVCSRAAPLEKEATREDRDVIIGGEPEGDRVRGLAPPPLRRRCRREDRLSGTVLGPLTPSRQDPQGQLSRSQRGGKGKLDI